MKRETHHEIRIPERDVTYIVLSDYVIRLSTDINRTGSEPVSLGIKYIIPKLT